MAKCKSKWSLRRRTKSSQWVLINPMPIAHLGLIGVKWPSLEEPFNEER